MPRELRLGTAKAKADRLVAEELARLRLTRHELTARQKSDPAKLALAARLRQETTLSGKQSAERLGPGKPKASRENNLSNYGAGVFAAGKALARRISAWICNERATPPAAKRTSQNAQVIFSRCLRAREPICTNSLTVLQPRVHKPNWISNDP